jgi:hypothetical protein
MLEQGQFSSLRTLFQQRSRQPLALLWLEAMDARSLTGHIENC